MSINKIHIYDFDGTLVNTPLKPDAWKGGWWGKSHSLLPPFMPHYFELKEKGLHFLNQKVVESYLLSKNQKNIHTVMMTGRHWGLRREVMNILCAFELCTKYDCENLKEESNHFVFISGGKTLEGKLQRIGELFAEFPEVVDMEIWEDRNEHVQAFRQHSGVLKKIRPAFRGIIVHEPPNWE